MLLNCVATGQRSFIIMLILNCWGVILSIVSIICIVANSGIDQSLRGILLSFSVANVIGTGMLAHDSITLLCKGNHFLDFSVTVTMALSITHMNLLILTEYISLTTSWKQRARDHTGLLLMSWIISVTVGSMNVVTLGHSGKLVFVVVFCAALLSMLRSLIAVMAKHKKKEYLLEKYKSTFLRQTRVSPPGKTKNILKRSWRIKVLAIIICSYIICSIPWVVNEFSERLGPHNSTTFLHTFGLLTYSVQFYFPSAICIYMRYIQQKITSEWALRTYRYRDTLV